MQASVFASASNPLAKVLQLLNSLEAKIIHEGEMELKAYEEYKEWCDDASKNKGFEIKTLTAQKERLVATIEKCTSDGEEASVKVEDLAKSISTSESELKDATAIRAKERAEFSAAEAELTDSIDTLNRAINTLEREMAKNPALVQAGTVDAKEAKDMKKLAQSVGAIIDAAGIAGTDRKKLVALVQSRQQDREKEGDKEAEKEDEKAAADEAALGAPAPDAYKSHSTSIVEVLEDLKEKAEGELSDLRKAESSAQFNYDMLKQSLDDQTTADKKDMADEKDAKSEAEGCVATSEGDLAGTTKDLADAAAALSTAQTTCMTVAADHETTVNSRTEELKALATAKKILKDSSGGAVQQTYSLLQFEGSSRDRGLLQVEGSSRMGSGLRTELDLAEAEVVTLIKKLARKHHSTALAQLASKITAVLRFGAANGEDPFTKVKGLIQDLIQRLTKEAEGEAAEKSYCDGETAKTNDKKSELQADVDKLSAKTDKAVAASTALKQEVAELQKELAELAKTQAEMDTMRMEDHDDYAEAKAVLTQGLDGVRKALSVLREYYGGAAMLQDDESSSLSSMMQQPPAPEKHGAAGGAGGSIINILEVCESDFAKNLAEKETAEADAEAEYAKITQENKMTKALKDQDVKYKTAESKSLDKTISELRSDRETTTTELDAVLEYSAKLKERCTAKADTYEERKSRRESEIAGLKEALGILENESAFVQKEKPLLFMQKGRP